MPVSAGKRMLVTDEAEPRDHFVHFYETDDFLYDMVAEFVGAALGSGDPTVIIATKAHRAGFRQRLESGFFDVDRACAAGKLVLADAAEMLATFMIGEVPNWDLFKLHVGGLVRKAKASRRGCRPRAYGEMVDVLWRIGNRRGAIRLEEMWNELARSEEFVLVCAYGIDGFESEDSERYFERVCATHRRVLSVEKATPFDNDDARRHHVAHLQERTRTLEAEVRRSRELERSLREREEELRDFLENAVEGLRWVGPDGIILWANKAEMDLLGYTPSEYVGHHISEFHVDAERILQSLYRGNTLRDYEAQLRCKDGSIKDVLIHSNVLWREGRFVHTRCFTRDITERKRAEASLREQARINGILVRVGAALSTELELDTLVQKITDEGTALCGAQAGAFFYKVTNDAGESYPLYALSGIHRDAFAKYPMPRSTAVFAPTFNGNEVVRLDDVTKDPRYGTNAPYRGMPKVHAPVRSYLAVPVKSRCGEVLGALLFGHEEPGVFDEEDERILVAVSAQAAVAIDNAKLFQALRRAEEGSEREREKLRRLFMQSPAVIVMFRGPEHVCDFVNAAATDLLGGRNVIGQTLCEVLPAIPETKVEILDHVLRTGERFVGTEISVTHDWDGNQKPYERFFNIVHEAYAGADGAIEGVISFGFEVTEEVLAKRKVQSIVRELENANRTKDDFLATVSHELRTPLNAILGWVRMLRSGNLPLEKEERALETIERNANAQAQLIDDLLDVSRIISGKLRLEVSTIDVPTVVDNAIEAVRPAATAKGVTLRQTVDPNAGPILGDAARLQQVVWNLLTNAVKFSPRGGTAHVVVRKRDSTIEVIVADNGHGIPPEFLPHAFERFRQADATASRKYGGLGLGLAIVRNLVELHGGSVGVESEGIGKGATFTVRLPISPLRSSSLERPPAVRLVSSPDIQTRAELVGLHVLVVDDEPDARDLLAEMLSRSLAKVSTAGSAADALRMLQDARPDVLVSDIGMPGEDGYALIKKVRALPPTHGGKTPAVALTAYTRFEDRTRSLVAGYNVHVPKPVEPAELLAVLASLAALLPRAS